MKKWFVSFLVALIAIPVFSANVFAETEDIFAEGTEFEISSDNDNFGDSATVVMEEGEPFQVKLNYGGMPVVQDVDVSIGEVKDKDNGFIHLEMEDLSQPITLSTTHVYLPDNPFVYDLEFDIGAKELKISEIEDPSHGNDDGNEEGGTSDDDSSTGNGEDGTNDDDSSTDNSEGNEEAGTNDDDSSSGNNEVNEEGNEEETNQDAEENDVYTIDFVTDSGATNNQFDNPVTLIYEDGKKYIQMTGSSGNYIQSLKINGEEVTWGVREIDGKFIAQFEHPGELSEDLTLSMIINTGRGIMAHDVPLAFDESTKEVAESQEYTVYDASLPFPGDKLGVFTINFVTDSRATNSQFDNPVTLIYEDGKTYIQMTGSSGNYIESLKINGEEVTWGVREIDGEFITQFEHPGELDENLNFSMVINTGSNIMPHDVPLSFDESTKTVAESQEYTIFEESLPFPSESEENPSTGTEEEEIGENDEENENPFLADNAYEIDYSILHETDDKLSASAGFFEKPAILLEKDGVYYLQITTNSNQYIDALSNKFGEFAKVGGDENGFFTYQFRVDGDLTDVQFINMVISVPGVYDEEPHKVRLVLNPEVMEEVNSAEHLLVISTDNANGVEEDGFIEPTPNPISELDPNTPSKPELGEEDDNGNGAVEETQRNALNPQTGENTNILLYVLLLIGSAIPLAIQVKRRFA